MALLDLVLNRTPQGGLAAAATQTRMSKGVSFTGNHAGRLVWEGDDHGTGATAYRCVMAIAGNAAGLDLVVLVNDEAAERHDVSDLFNVRPNPLMSARTFKEVLFARLEWKGEAFVYLDRGDSGTGPITDAWPVYDPCVPVVDRDAAGVEALLGYQVDVGAGRKVGLLPSEVLWLRYPDPDDAWGCIAPWTAARFAADADREIQQWQRKEVKHGGRAQSLVYLGDLTSEQHDAAVAEFNGSIQSNTKRHLLVSGPAPANVSRLGATAEELAFLESRAANREEVCLAFGVPKDVLLGGSTYENQRAAKTFLWSDTILPKLEVVASEVERQALDTPRESAAFDVSGVEALQENADALAKRTNDQLTADLITIDEGRARFGLEPLPNGMGNMTLTQYRRAVFAASSSTAADPVRSVAGVSRHRLLVGARGQRRLERPAERRTTPAALESRDAVLTVEEVTARYDAHEARGEKIARKLLERQERAVLKALQRLENAERKRLRLATTDTVTAEQRREFLETRMSIADLFDSAYWRDESRDALESFVAGVWDDGAQRVARRLGISFATLDTRVAAAMLARLDHLAGQITDTTQQVLEENVLAPGIAAGASTDELAASIRARFAGMKEHRALTIARTETVGGFNAASRLAAIESGVVARRTWLAANDSRVRDSHRDLDGYTTRGMDDHYPIGVMFPGDPAGPPAETIRCRCVEEYDVEDD